MYKFTVLLTAMFAVFIGWVIYLADTGQKSIFFALVRIIPYGDKIGHFFLFGLLALGTNIALKRRGISAGNIFVPFGGIVIFGVVIVEEFSQKLMPGHTFDVNDMLASLAGVVLFSLATLNRRLKVSR